MRALGRRAGVRAAGSESQADREEAEGGEMRTTVRVEHRSRVSSVIVTRGGDSRVIRELYAPAPACDGEQRDAARDYAERLRDDVRNGKLI